MSSSQKTKKSNPSQDLINKVKRGELVVIDNYKGLVTILRRIYVKDAVIPKGGPERTMVLNGIPSNVFVKFRDNEGKSENAPLKEFVTLTRSRVIVDNEKYTVVNSGSTTFEGMKKKERKGLCFIQERTKEISTELSQVPDQDRESEESLTVNS